MFSRTLLRTSKNYFFSINPLSELKHTITINIENLNQNIDLFLRDFDLIIRVLIDQVVHLLRVNGSVRVQLLYQVFHVGTNVVVKTYIRVSLDFCLLELFSELFHSVDVFAFFRGFYVFDDASSEVCTVNFALLLLEYHELKAEQLLDDLSAELHHLLA